MTNPSRNLSRRSIHRHLVAGTMVVAILVAALGFWARSTEIAGAVIASGVVVVELDVKKVQHPTGGIVGELSVRDGDRVQAGDVLVRLDETQTKANLAVLTNNLDELYARKARLEAEQDGANLVYFPDELMAREPTDSEVAHI